MTEVRDRLERIEDAIHDTTDVLSQVQQTLARIDQRNRGADEVHVDHETRIRALERWRWSMPAASAGSAVAALTSLLTVLAHH